MQYNVPIIVLNPEKESLIHLMLLLPGGTGLEAVGAFNPVHLRSDQFFGLSREAVHQALAKKGAAMATPK